jgi:uncharacterized zinc-type alcohol dehydrogenase-like protein
MTVKAWAALKKSSLLVAHNFETQKLGAMDVEIQITHCGLCRSDVHLIDNDWGVSHYPLVPGHEIIGLVSKTGSQVTHLKKGDRVGVGWQRGACLTCEVCARGDENLCHDSQATAVDGTGGFADFVMTDSRFAFLIPENLPSEQTAPLLCGGITVYSPLRKFGILPHMNVGVLGIGGLGHLGIQFANKMGCHVTALSSSNKKEKEAHRLGAHDYLIWNEKRSLSKHKNSLDIILSTANVNIPWENLMGLLRADGKLCILGVPEEPINIRPYFFIDGRKSICGSPIGGRSTIMEMLEFASRHNILAQTEVLPMNKVNQAIQNVRDNKTRFRMVLKNNS